MVYKQKCLNRLQKLFQFFLGLEGTNSVLKEIHMIVGQVFAFGFLNYLTSLPF